jgi:hypothetical protein
MQLLGTRLALLLRRLSLLLSLSPGLRIFFCFFGGHVMAHYTATGCAEHRMTTADKVTPHTPDGRAFKATRGIGLGNS